MPPHPPAPPPSNRTPCSPRPVKPALNICSLRSECGLRVVLALDSNSQIETGFKKQYVARESGVWGTADQLLNGYCTQHYIANVLRCKNNTH